MDAIRRMLSLRATVLRDGQRRSVDGEALVPGDIVLLEAGDKVPADLRLLHAPGLQIQEGILTGESVPVDKHTRPVARDAALGDRACMAFSGTLVTSGSAKGLVVATGPDTEIGRISGMLAGVEALNTLVVMEIFHLFFIRNIYGTSLTWRAARGTRVVWATVIAITAAQFAITYLTPLQRVFATEAVPFTDGALIVGVGVVFFALIEVEKQLRLSFTGRAARPA